MLSFYLIFAVLCGIMSLSCITVYGDAEDEAEQGAAKIIGFIFFIVTYLLVMGALEIIRKAI